MNIIRRIDIEGSLETKGIVNRDRKITLNGNKNHLIAKKDAFGREFTSSRCLRQLMYKTLQPNQPTLDEFETNYIQLAASEIGLVRGIMNANNQLKRSSPLCVLDATSILPDSLFNKVNGQYEYIFFDQGGSSKFKESFDEKSDPSMFSIENAHQRTQSFNAFIDIQKLQLIEQGANQTKIVLEKDEDIFLKQLKSTFKKMNTSEECSINMYQLSSALSPYRVRGILLNDEQMSSLIYSTLSKIIRIEGFKTGAFITAKTESFKVKLFVNDEIHSTIELPMNEFMTLLKKNEFKFVKFYQKIKDK